MVGRAVPAVMRGDGRATVGVRIVGRVVETTPDPLERIAGTAVLFLFPITTLGFKGLSVGMGLTLFLGLVLVKGLPRFRTATLIVLVWALALLSVPLLVDLSLDNVARSVDSSLMWRVMLLFGSGALALLVLLWGRWKFGDRYTLAVFALGTLVQAVVTPALWQDNPWKYALAWPVAVLLLTMTRRSGVLLLGALAAASVAFDFRSFAGLCLIAGLLVLWRRRTVQGRARTLRPLAIVAAVSYLVLLVGTQLALGGYLGYEIQSRTFAQTGGGQHSLLLSARPEWAATWGLMQERPVGYGPGVVPALDDVTAGRSGLYSVGAATEGEYVDGYLFGGRIELHSVAADMWVNFGPFGLLLAVLLGGSMALGLGRLLALGGVRGWQIFVLLLGLWDLLFSPMTSNLLTVVVAIAIALPQQRSVVRPPHLVETASREHVAEGDHLAGVPRW